MNVVRTGMIVFDGERPDCAAQLSNICGTSLCVLEWPYAVFCCLTSASCHQYRYEGTLAVSESLSTDTGGRFVPHFMFQNIQVRDSYTLLGNLGHVRFDEF